MLIKLKYQFKLTIGGQTQIIKENYTQVTKCLQVCLFIQIDEHPQW